ncbi:MAG TPA: sigma-70 family RNA polymerase sigma factor [Gemmatimonadaceae bacterium]|nr:sigma-70 family RNA polymerase sigma factor [Gemmatimonadaceae bacterium]
MHSRFDRSGEPLQAGAATVPAPDDDAWGEQLERYWRPLVAYVTRLLGDGAAAEDVVQRAFVRLWERGHAVPAGDAVRPFLYRVVRNLASNEWRRQQTYRAWLSEESASDVSMAPPGLVVEERELASALAAAVERLPTRRREVFVLSRYHALSNAQIAEVLAISPQTVANQLVSALRDLRVMLGPHLDERPFPALQIIRGGDRGTG